MIPRREDVEVRQRIDVGRLEEPDGETIRYPSWLGTQRDYSAIYYNSASWHEAAAALAEERRVLAAADVQTTDAEQFEDFAYEHFEAEGAMYGYVELGVTGLVYALNAAGCVTASCCRGHAGSPRDLPQVLFACDSRRAGLLVPLARQAQCALENFDGGGLVAYAPSVTELVRLGELVVEHHAEFDRLPLPAERGRYHDADDGDDEEAGSGFDEEPAEHRRPGPGQEKLF